MPRASLVIQTFSDAYVHNFARFVHRALRTYLDPDAALVLCDQIDGTEHPEGLIFIIGENFRPFTRRPGCRYVLMNLSVVTLLGNPLDTSLNGYRQMWRKRRMLSRKLPLIDVLLDYYPPQTRALQRQISCPVFGFDVALATSEAPLPAAARDFDVCFVGGINDRRRTILDRISAQGAVLSPSSGAPIEDIAAASRICLNIHSERSNHLEVPRIVAALSRGTPVVSEASYGLQDLTGGRDFVAESRLSDLPERIGAMLSDPARLSRLGEDCHAWYRDDYLIRAERNWQELCLNLSEMPSRLAAE